MKTHVLIAVAAPSVSAPEKSHKYAPRHIELVIPQFFLNSRRHEISRRGNEITWTSQADQTSRIPVSSLKQFAIPV